MHSRSPALSGNGTMNCSPPKKVKQHYLLLQRNLIYTAVTRGKRLVVLIGSKEALAAGVRNDRTAKRYTYLAERLRNL